MNLPSYENFYREKQEGVSSYILKFRKDFPKYKFPYLGLATSISKQVLQGVSPSRRQLLVIAIIYSKIKKIRKDLERMFGEEELYVKMS